MQKASPSVNSVDEYIASFPMGKQSLLQSVRQIVLEEAPEAKEGIAYKMPAYQLNGPLVYFALFENHLGLYPTPEGISAFESELIRYKQGKGSVQFPLDQPLPMDLIRRIVRQRVLENKDKPKKK
ncbi:MAG: DUF1801 domain-containing protein [Anaerolineaceae bacterium]